MSTSCSPSAISTSSTTTLPLVLLVVVLPACYIPVYALELNSSVRP